MVLNDPKSFSIDIEGSTTKQKYTGVFKVRLLLSHRQKLQKDESRRQLLGTFPDQASVDAMKTAIIFSTIWAHMVEAPSWWKEAANGIDLLDEDPVGMVYDKIISLQEELLGKVEKDGEKAKEAIKEEMKK